MKALSFDEFVDAYYEINPASGREGIISILTDYQLYDCCGIVVVDEDGDPYLDMYGKRFNSLTSRITHHKPNPTFIRRSELRRGLRL